jgi:Ca2+-binding EF-hand superfamily protein
MHRSANGNVSHRPRLQNLFWQMDDDESGTLTAEEMQQLVKDS